MTYWIYESWSLNKAIVHKADCDFCQNGSNRQGETRGRANGNWLGPFGDGGKAMEKARATNRGVIRPCKHCLEQKAA